MQIKKELRSRLLYERKLISKEKKDELSFKIAEKLFLTEEFKKADRIFCYVSKNDEICTEKIISYALSIGKKVAAPLCKGDLMLFKYITGEGDLEKGCFSVYEPKKSCSDAEITPDTVCITPGLCFNRQGYRIGYGKGFYDRFFEKNDCIKIGLCFEENIRAFTPDKYDKAVDMIVSERGVMRIIPPQNEKQHI